MSDPGPSTEPTPGTAGAAAPAVLSRLHPITLVLQVPTVLIKWVGPFALISFAFGVGSFGKAFQWAVVGSLFGTIEALVRYATLRFGIHDDRLLIRSGLFERRQRTIPIDQIHNVDLRAGPLERLFRVTSIKVETAGGDDTEASLSVVSTRVADRFRDEILARRAHLRESEPATPPERVARNLTFRELLLAGATENRVGVIVAALLGLGEALDDTGFDMRGELSGRLEVVFGSGPFATGIAVAAATLLFLVAGGVVSMSLFAFRYHGYSLTKATEGLRRSHGLLTRFESLVPIRRIQVILLEENPLRRIFGYTTMRVQSAGSPEDDKARSTILYPLLPIGEASTLARLVFPGLDLDLGKLRPVHPLALRRGFIRYSVILTFAVGLVALFASRWALLALPVAWLLARFLARKRYRSLRYALLDGYVLARGGVWTRRLWIIPRERIQTVAIVQSPFQRRYGLSSLIIDTAGAATWSAARVIDLPTDEAERVFFDLAASAAALEWAEAV